MFRVTGGILLDGEEVNDPTLDVIELRRRVGMVFQRATPFPKSIYENVAYGLRIAGVRDRRKCSTKRWKKASAARRSGTK